MPKLFNSSINTAFENFLQQHPLDRVLLGLSGGSDSICLFYLMIEYGIAFQAVYIDHGWRESSVIEKNTLSQLCEDHQVVFHSCSIDNSYTSDLENQARQRRFKAFASLIHEHQLQGLVLGHHQDDLIETILKRVLEGSNLDRLYGMKPCSKFNDIKILRPLLSEPKEAILQWLDQHDFQYFEDSTNQDTHFLRNKMRLEIIPYLEKMFGKKIGSSLLRLGKFSAELKALTQEYTQMFLKGPMLDLSSHKPKSPLGWILVTKQFLNQYGLYPSQQTLEQIVFHIKEQKAHKRIRLSDQEVWIHRGIVSIKQL